ncbi:MAG: hypothetical protein AABX38_03110 [Candidatus Micrarchaeota archaeon]
MTEKTEIDTPDSSRALGEVGRQLIHIISGLILIAILISFGRGILVSLLFGLLISLSMIINLRIFRESIFIVDYLEEKFERKNAPFAWWGPSFYALGALFIAIFLNDPRKIVAGIFILAVGDGFSTLIGIRGTHKLPFNDKKSIEGTLAFFVSCLPLYVLIGDKIFIIAAVAALTEAYAIGVEDNLAIPLITTVMLSIL